MAIAYRLKMALSNKTVPKPKTAMPNYELQISIMPFTYRYTVRLSDTDAAGVIYFANLLSICHEAYEDSLLNFGIELNLFLIESAIAIPIVHTSANFKRPILWGDSLLVDLTPAQLSDTEFEIHYQLSTTHLVADALTRHVCIHPSRRTRIPIPDKMKLWIERFNRPQ